MNDNRTTMRNMLIGAGLMFAFDPRMGRRRRSLIRDQLLHFERVLMKQLSRSSKDFRYRTVGRMIDSKSRLLGETVPDRILVERVRSQIGRVVSNPHSVKVVARNGIVVLSGPVFIDQVRELISCVAQVRGVYSIRNQLETHDVCDTSPSLGVHRIRVGRPAWLAWPRVFTDLFLASFIAGEVYFSRRRNYYGVGLGALAFTLFARGIDLNPRPRRTHPRVVRKYSTFVKDERIVDPLIVARMAHH